MLSIEVHSEQTSSSGGDVQPTMASEEDSTNFLYMTHLFEIPLEILVIILRRYIPHKDKQTLRQVHPFLKSLLDTCIGFKASLDNKHAPEKFEFVSQLAVRRASIGNLTWEKNLPRKPTFQEIFRYPCHLQEVRIKGNIQAELFSEIVRQGVALRTLEMCSGSNIKGNTNKKEEKGQSQRCVLPEVEIFSDYPSESQQSYLPKCKTLKLLLNQDSTATLSDLNCEAVLGVLRSVNSRSLEKIVVQGWISSRFSAARLTLMAAECLERNPNIESFFLGVIYEHLVDEDTPVTDEDIRLRKITQEKLKRAGDIVNIQKFGISTLSFDMMLWKDLLKRQNNLVHLSFTVDLTEGVFCAEMFSSSRHSLRQIIIRGKFLTSFNFNWVEDCENLKEICLHNLEYVDDENTSILHTVNAVSIPCDVESLILFQTITRTDDVVAVLRKLRLRTLVLFKTGNTAGETGINVDCLRLIFGCRSLQSTLLVRFVAPNPVEAAELVKILQTLNNGEIHREVGAAENVWVAQEVGNENNDDEPPPLIDASSLEVETQQGTEPSVEVTTTQDKEPDATPSSDPEPSGSNLPSTSVKGAEICSDSNLKKESNNETEAASVKSLTPTASETRSNNFSKWLSNKRSENVEGVSQSSSCVPGSEPHEPHLLPQREVQPKDEPEHVDADAPPSSEHPEIQVSNDPSPSPNNNDVVEETSPAAEDNDNDDGWEDMESDSDSSDSMAEDGIFDIDLDLDELNLDVLEQVGAVGMAGNEGNVQLVINLQHENDLEDMLGLLDPIANNNLNINFGFILDGVIDIQDNDPKRSRWTATEDEEGHLTYTLKISID